MKVLFAPDWREGSPYQRLLADALATEGVEVEYPHGTHRLLPLYRLACTQRTDLFHLHWPEAYWQWGPKWYFGSRRWRYPLDVTLASLQQPFVYTAHNLWPHNEPHTLRMRALVAATLARADLIFAHSDAAKAELVREFGAEPNRCVVIPHGDLSPALPPPVVPSQARRALGLDSAAPVALMFGRIEPYKGIEEIVDWWKAHHPEAKLVIVGEAYRESYARELAAHIGSSTDILLNPHAVSDAELSLWLSAASVCLFNYRQIFTSGAASMARSRGVPLLMPRRLTAVDLAEPTSYVQRFEGQDDFIIALNRALALPADFDTAASWRESISWPRIARITAESYRRLLTR